jgi:hypothetical protein
MVQPRIRQYVTWMVIAAAGVMAGVVNAQEHPAAPNGPAQILVTVREMLKPGEQATHARLEVEYASVLNASNGSEYYLGMGAISGKQQLMFLSGYSSLEEMSDVHDYNATILGDKLDKINSEHNATLNGVNTAIWRLRPDLSNPDTASLGKMRFMELTQIHVKLGHNPEFADVVKQIRAGWMKTEPDFHYVIYQQIFGSSADDTYLVVIAVKSLADFDKHHAMMAKYRQSLGEDAYKRMLDFESANYDGTVSNLFVFTPSMSRLPESWIKDDLAFWEPTAPADTPAKTGAPDQK